MKTYILILVVAVLSTTTIVNAQEITASKRNFVKYPAAKAQNESTFSEMLPAKLFSKVNAVPVPPVGDANSAVAANMLPEVPPSKKNCLLKHPSVVADAGSSPKKPGSKMNAVSIVVNDTVK